MSNHQAAFLAGVIAALKFFKGKPTPKTILKVAEDVLKDTTKHAKGLKR